MEPKPGLGERKRRSAMRRVQEAGLGLFEARGFENVTVEEIAEAAEVSASSIYRYFGTKEMVVLYDDLDARFFAAMEVGADPASPVESARRLVTELMMEYFIGEEALAKRKLSLAFGEPALQSALLAMMSEYAEMAAEGLARAAGRAPDDLQIRVVAACLTWSLFEALRAWHANGYRVPLLATFEEALAVLERGLHVD